MDLGRRPLIALLPSIALGACQSVPPPRASNPGDESDIRRVERYLDGLHTLTARFLQIWPNGSTSRGTAWLQRPGHLRLQYDPPNSSILVVADGRVVVQDPVRHSTSSMPLSRTPLAILLTDTIRLSGDVTVTNVRRQPGELRISMVQTQRPDNGSLTVILTDQPLMLVGIDIVDARNQETRLRLFDVRSGVPIDEGSFKIEAPVEPTYIGHPPES